MNDVIVRIPCHKCGGRRVDYYDCGYSTFNPGHVKCRQCGFKVEAPNCDSLNPWPVLEKAWDHANKNIQVDSIEQLKEILASRRPIQTCSMTLCIGDLLEIIKLKNDVDECHRTMDQIDGYSSKCKGSASLLKRLKKLAKEIRG